jgi:hypothetical protein
LFSFDPSHIFVDAQGRLHLRVAPSGAAWFGSEAILDAPLGAAPAPLGYGAYLFETEGDLANLDRFVVFGAFTWDPFGDQAGTDLDANRELDFEASRWGEDPPALNAQSVVQPYELAGNRAQFPIPAEPLRWLFLWLPDRVIFQTFTPTAQIHQRCESLASLPSPVHPSCHPNNSLPEPGRSSVHLNAWLNSYATAPSNGAPAEIIVKRFVYLPEPGDTLQLALTGAAVLLLATTPRARRRDPVESSGNRNFRFKMS